MFHQSVSTVTSEAPACMFHRKFPYQQRQTVAAGSMTACVSPGISSHCSGGKLRLRLKLNRTETNVSTAHMSAPSLGWCVWFDVHWLNCIGQALRVQACGAVRMRCHTHTHTHTHTYKHCSRSLSTASDLFIRTFVTVIPGLC